MHIALAGQRVVHSESCRQVVVRMTAHGNLQVVVEQRTVVGMCAVVDNQTGALHRALAAEVGDTLLRDDDVDVVLRVILMAHEGNDAGNQTTLGCRRAGEDRDVGIALEVARATDAVHHLRATDLGGVHVAIEVALDGGVDGDDTQSANDFRVVGNLALAQRQVILEVIDVVVDLHEALVIDRERAR